VLAEQVGRIETGRKQMSFKSGFESRESRSLIRQVSVSSKSEVRQC